MRSCSSSVVLVDEPAEQIASMHPAWPTIADDPQTGGRIRREDVVEPAGELRVPVAPQEAEPASLLLQHHEEVAGLLGDPGTVGVGGHPGQVAPASFQLDEEQ